MQILVISVQSLYDWNKKNGTDKSAIQLTDEEFAAINEEYEDGWSYDGLEEILEEINVDSFAVNPGTHYIRAIREPRTYFEITSVSRDDLESAGFDASRVDDDIMEKLAGDMADAYVGNGFWIDLPILAENLGIPKKGENPEDDEEEEI